MSTCKLEEHAYCHYCMQRTIRHEHDHFPIPQECGGTETVPTCINCHDLKDRGSLDDWDATFAITGLTNLIYVGILQVPPNGAISKADVEGLLRDIGDHQAVWGHMSPAGRLVYARFRRVAEVVKFRSLRVAA